MSSAFSKYLSGSFCLSFIAILFIFSCSTPEDPRIMEDNSSIVDLSAFKNEPIPGEYIVVFHEDRLSFRMDPENYDGNLARMKSETEAFLRHYKISPEAISSVYALAINGFCARVGEDKIASIKNDPRVRYVEQNRKGTMGNAFGRAKKSDPDPGTQQTPWGIERVGGPFIYRGKSKVFVLDTGIDTNHPDLNVDVVNGFNPYGSLGFFGFDDENGHGTHVAGTIGALNNSTGVVGVAPGVPLVPVKIFVGRNAGYTFEGILSGIEYVGAKGKPGDVANLSFGGPDESTAIDEAVLNVSERRKIWMVIAAGNSRLPGTAFSPARVNGRYTITVSAMDSNDRLANFSHFGFPIQYAAPGVRILSTIPNGSYGFSSGTSMAAPHVAGLRLLGKVEEDGFVSNYPSGIAPDPIAFRSKK